jgi:uncharacterized repeat protein (TIGR03803 family)
MRFDCCLYSWRLRVALLASAAALLAAPARASEFTVLHSFDGADGASPESKLAIGGDGSLYGEASYGGDSGWGTLFRIDAGGAFSVLHRFDGTDGGGPLGELILDADGSLWGTTSGGGVDNRGVAFRLDPSGQLSAVPMRDGAFPEAGLTRGPDGLFYGTTFYGGLGDGRGDGTVFRLDPGTLAIQTLHAFRGHDGRGPACALLFVGGQLAGTAAYGGDGDRGTAFVMDLDGRAFGAQQAYRGARPYAGLTLDAQGRAWGVADEDNAQGRGLGGIFTIAPDGAVTVAHRFAADYSEGASSSRLLLGKDGWLYGMAYGGGAAHHGTIYRFDPEDGPFEVLHDFTGQADDGGYPSSSLTQDASGAFYGTTTAGGAFGQGVVFRFVP